MNGTFIVSVIVVAFILVFVIGGMIQAWLQRKDANLPRAATWAGASVIILVTVGALAYGAVSIVNFGGTFVNNAFNSSGSAPALPSFDRVDVPQVDNGR